MRRINCLTYTSALLLLLLTMVSARDGTRQPEWISVNPSLRFTSVWEPVVKYLLTLPKNSQHPWRLDGIRVAEDFPGNDLGAQINSAITHCEEGHCLIYVGKPGTIASSPDLPEGYALKLAPGAYKLTTTWRIKHRNTIYDFSGAQIDYAPAKSGPAFLVGKDLQGLVATTGNEVSWISGSKLFDFDAGDHIFIGGNAYNVGAVESPTKLRVIGSAGNVTNAVYAGYINPEITVGHNFGSVELRDLVLSYQGGSDRAVGVKSAFVTSLILSNIRVSNFVGKDSVCFEFEGTIAANLYNIQCSSSSAGVVLTGHTAGGMTIPSNHNRFFGGDIVASKQESAISALIIDGGSSYNQFYGFRFEGNNTRNTVLIQNLSEGTLIDGAWFERNGDGTSSSIDINNQSAHTSIENSNFVSSPKNHPACGIETSGAGHSAWVVNNRFQLHYSTSYAFIDGARGTTEGNTVVGSSKEPRAASKRCAFPAKPNRPSR